ncbi:MAG: helix-turn-helix domain-containing protein [Verrucomicrobiota bacterium]|nr:helix-turn-helix domain-containing protein [Verrucomicrobiota bacterium]
MSDTNSKVFELARPKTPDEIAEESTRSMMPKLRRMCSKDLRLKRNVGAKWLFDRISDDSFMECFGGNARGKLWTTLRDLNRRYGHDEDTLSSWLKKLEDTGWIWIERGWPVWCIAISGVTQRPDVFSPEYARLRARADKTATDGFVPENDETAKNGANTGESPEAKPPLTVSVPGSRGQRNRENREHIPPLTGDFGGDSRVTTPVFTGGETGSHGQTLRNSPVCSTVSDGDNKETPGSKGVIGARECGAGASARAVSHTPFPKFEALDMKMVPRLRNQWGKDVIENLKEKIFRLENARQLSSNRKDIVIAYRQRIREIKDWMHGEIAAKPGEAML